MSRSLRQNRVNDSKKEKKFPLNFNPKTLNIDKQKQEKEGKMNEGSVNIFLSHRHEDSEAVLKLKSRLEELSAVDLSVFNRVHQAK